MVQLLLRMNAAPGNHHTVGMGGISEMGTSAPGNTTIRPKSCAPLAQTLKLNGYATAQVGKCHEVPPWQTSPAGPFDNWPTGSGFECFYGFVCAETNQYYPAIYEGTSPVEPDKTPEQGYHFTFSADETIDLGREMGSPVSPDYGPRGNAFSGDINWVEIDVDKAALDADHRLTGEERYRVAMALQ